MAEGWCLKMRNRIIGRAILALAILVLTAYPSTAAHRKKNHRASNALGGILRYLTGMPRPVIHRELPTSRIESLAGFKPSRFWQNPGLTIGSHELKTSFMIGGSQHPGSSGVNAWLQSLEVVFDYTDLNVYESNDYADGTCEATQIHLHEMQHVAVHRRLYAKYSNILKREIQASGFPLKSAPGRYHDMSQAKADIAQRVKVCTEGVYARFRQELSVENDKLDTRANYKATQSRCKNWK
jgi:hypothetical protein